MILVHNSGFLQEVVQDMAPDRSPLNQTRYIELAHERRGRHFCFLAGCSKTNKMGNNSLQTENKLSFCITVAI